MSHGANQSTWYTSLPCVIIHERWTVIKRSLEANYKKPYEKTALVTRTTCITMTIVSYIRFVLHNYSLLFFSKTSMGCWLICCLLLFLVYSLRMWAKKGSLITYLHLYFSWSHETFSKCSLIINCLRTLEALACSQNCNFSKFNPFTAVDAIGVFG